MRADVDVADGTRSHDDCYYCVRAEIGFADDRIAEVGDADAYVVEKVGCASPEPFRTSGYRKILRILLPICESAGHLFYNI